VEPGWIDRGEARALIRRFLPMRLERWLIRLGLLASVLGALAGSLALLALANLDGPLEIAAPPGPIEIPTDPTWYVVLFAVAVVVGAVSAVALVLSFSGREARAMRVAMAAALIDLVAGGLTSFYVTQFGASVSILVTLILLLLILDHRGRLAAAAHAHPAADTGTAAPMPAA
jgi:hypothetical protein